MKPDVAEYLDPQAKKNQAQRIIARFGGPYKLARMLRQLDDPRAWRDPSQIYRWTYSRDKRGGYGGGIPLAMWPYILQAARLEGLILTLEEMSPL